MTGEITLRGEVLPIGGLKEKLLAAGRGGIKTVLIPEENVKDLAEIPDEIKNRLDIHPVRWIEQVLEHALERHPTPLVRRAGAGGAGGSGGAGRRADRADQALSDRARARRSKQAPRQLAFEACAAACSVAASRTRKALDTMNSRLL